MPDEGAVAVAEAPVAEPAAQPSTEILPGESTQATEKPEPEKTDGRKQPDALRKRIADLRRQADSVADPAEKQRLIEDAKALNDGMGKMRAYEQHFPTVKEARETKALVESLGGREGLTSLQNVQARAAEIDRALETGDLPSWPGCGKRLRKAWPSSLRRFSRVWSRPTRRSTPKPSSLMR